MTLHGYLVLFLLFLLASAVSLIALPSTFFCMSCKSAGSTLNFVYISIPPAWAQQQALWPATAPTLLEARGTKERSSLGWPFFCRENFGLDTVAQTPVVLYLQCLRVLAVGWVAVSWGIVNVFAGGGYTNDDFLEYSLIICTPLSKRLVKISFKASYALQMGKYPKC